MYTPGTVVVIRGGYGVAGASQNSTGIHRSESIAKLVIVGRDEVTVRRARGRGGRYMHWSPPCRIPADAIVREATRRELVLGYPSDGGPPLRPVTL